MEKIVNVYPAWDKRNSDPKKNYGVNSVEIWFALKGSKGAVHFSMYTGWYLPYLENKSGPMAGTLGYHAYSKRYDEESETEKCEYLGCKCYGSVYFTRADDFLTILIEEGTEGIWKQLEYFYNETFE